MTNTEPSSARERLVWALCTALVLAGGFHLALGRHHLNLSDEGFLWYGVQRTLEGEVPLRDFQSYEPGRYYWCALVGLVMGDGILAVRAAVALFQVIGLTAGLLAAQRVLPRRWMVVPLGIVLLLWMFPRHKGFDASAALVGVYAGVRVLEDQRQRTRFLAGVGAGLAGFLGRNHGLYWVAGLTALCLLSAWKRRERGWLRALVALALGVLAGSLPLLAMVAFVPGFGMALVRSVLFFGEHGSNLPLPYPWPWEFGYEYLQAFERTALAAAFLLPIVVLSAGLLVALASDAAGLARRALLVSATFVGICYLHQASVRSDPQHLAQAIHPALLTAVALACLGRRRWLTSAVAVGSLLAMTAAAVPATNPVLEPWRPGGPAIDRVPFDAAGDQLLLNRSDASYVSVLQRVVRATVPDDAPLFLAPVFPTLYPLLERRAPTWQIYFLWRLDEETQGEIIRRLDEGGVDHALIIDTDPSGELRFESTNPLVWRHLLAEFEPIPGSPLPTGHHLLRRR